MSFTIMRNYNVMQIFLCLLLYCMGLQIIGIQLNSVEMFSKE